MKYDVIIAGGGLVGATLACALGRQGWRVALVEARAPRDAPAQSGFDPRVSAISPVSVRLLEALGVWPYVPSERRQAYRKMCVWDASGQGAVHFDAAAIGLAALGHIVENRILQAALETRIGELDTIVWHRPASLEALTLGAAGARARVADTRLRASLVVGADGRGSRVREAAGLRVTRASYRQCALVTTVGIERGHAETAWQRFLVGGPLALLPLPEGRGAIVWSTTPQHAETLLGLDDDDFETALGDAFGTRFGAFQVVGPRAIFPLQHLRARRYVSERVALVGDAAHTIHPLAGQGVNLGFLDAAALSEVLEHARARHRDPGSYASLRPYERWRTGHNLLIGEAMSGFKWLFGSRWAPLVLARNLGLDLTDRAAPLKKLFMRMATGGGGDLPRIARV